MLKLAYKRGFLGLSGFDVSGFRGLNQSMRELEFFGSVLVSKIILILLAKTFFSSQNEKLTSDLVGTILLASVSQELEIKKGN